MAAFFGFQYLYLIALKHSTSEQLNIYNKLIVTILGIPDNISYVITRTSGQNFTKIWRILDTNLGSRQ